MSFPRKPRNFYKCLVCQINFCMEKCVRAHDENSLVLGSMNWLGVFCTHSGHFRASPENPAVFLISNWIKSGFSGLGYFSSEYLRARFLSWHRKLMSRYRCCWSLGAKVYYDVIVGQVNFCCDVIVVQVYWLCGGSVFIGSGTYSFVANLGIFTRSDSVERFFPWYQLKE